MDDDVWRNLILTVAYRLPVAVAPEYTATPAAVHRNSADGADSVRHDFAVHLHDLARRAPAQRFQAYQADARARRIRVPPVAKHGAAVSAEVDLQDRDLRNRFSSRKAVVENGLDRIHQHVIHGT